MPSVLFLDAPEAVTWAYDPTYTYVTALDPEQAVPVPPDDWVPPSLEDPSGVHRVQVAVSSIRPKQWLGELLRAQVHDGQSERLDGSGACTISVPVDDPSIDLLTENQTTWGDITSGQLAVMDRAFHLVEDGKVTGCYVPRGPAPVRNGVVTFDCQAPSALWEGRTLGRGVTTDLLEGRGNFPGSGSYNSLGWTWTGSPGDIMFVDGARDARGLAIRGDALTDRLRIVGILSVEEETSFHNIVRASAFMKIPASSREGRTVMEMEVIKSGDALPYWPEEGDENIGAAVVEDDTETGDEWGRDPVTSFAVLPTGPYLVTVILTIYPQSASEWTAVDEVRMFQRDNLSTGAPKDLVDHLRIILQDAQNEAKGKTTWNMPVVQGGDTGIVEMGTWWREDDLPVPEALEAICSRVGGPDMPWVDRNWQIRATVRRGSIREDVTVGPDQIVSDEGWTYDPGGQVSQVRAQSDWGSDYWRHSAIATDTSRTAGHLVERVTRAPNDMGLRQLDEWVVADLYQKSQPQETGTIWVRPELGWRINVGDTFRLFQRPGGMYSNARVHVNRMVRVTERSFHNSRRLVALQWGTDEEAT